MIRVRFQLVVNILSIKSTLAMEPILAPIRWVQIFFVRKEGDGLEAAPSPPYSALTENEWNCVATAIICLRGVESDNFNSFY